jgi:hypothetical protein
MADYKDKLDDWQRAARRKAREIDEKLDLKGMVEEGARAAGDVARLGAETVANGAERLRSEAERLDQDQRLRDTARRAGDAASRGARQAAEVLREATGETGKKAEQRAGKIFKGAKKHYQRAAKVYDTSARVTRASSAATSAAFKAKDWVKQNPGKAAAVSFSLILGIRMGASFTGIDAVLLGAHPHWLTHSALPVLGLKKASEKFDAYLRQQEQLVAAGKLTEAERERVEFQRKMAKYVGAPLLGAFSCAMGAAMFAQIAQPGQVAGAPVSWLLGGNPFLDGVWLFANGVICFHQGYKFFMIALADQEDVNRVVREIKGLLPAAVTN